MSLFIKYIKSVLWRVAKRLFYTEEARCLKVNMRPIGCPETSVMNYHYTLRNTPEERWFHLHRDGSLKSPNSLYFALDGPGFEFRKGQRFFSLPKRPNRLWGSTQPSDQWVLAFFAGDKAVEV